MIFIPNKQDLVYNSKSNLCHILSGYFALYNIIIFYGIRNHYCLDNNASLIGCDWVV